MSLLVQLLQSIGLNLIVDVALELGLVALLVIVGKSLHVLSDVAGEDVLAESLGIELLGLDVVTGEAVLGVGDEETTVRSTLHGTEDTGTGGGTGETDIQEDLEWAALLTIDLSGLGKRELAIGLLNTGESLVKLKLLQGAAGEQKTSGIGGGPVGETVLEPLSAGKYASRQIYSQ